MVRFMSVILKWIRMFSVIGFVWNCKFQFLEKRIFLFLNVTRLVIMLLMKRALQRLIDDIQQPAQTGIEINFHFHQSNCFYDNVLEFFQSLCLILAAFTYCKRIWNFNENDTALKPVYHGIYDLCGFVGFFFFFNFSLCEFSYWNIRREGWLFLGVGGWGQRKWDSVWKWNRKCFCNGLNPNHTALAIMQNTVSNIFLLFHQHMIFTLGVYLYIASIYCQDIKFIVGK